MEPRRSKKVSSGKNEELNLPDIPIPTREELLETENEILARAISRLKYHNLIVEEFLTRDQLEVIKKYAP